MGSVERVVCELGLEMSKMNEVGGEVVFQRLGMRYMYPMPPHSLTPSTCYTFASRSRRPRLRSKCVLRYFATHRKDRCKFASISVTGRAGVYLRRTEVAWPCAPPPRQAGRPISPSFAVFAMTFLHAQARQKTIRRHEDPRDSATRPRYRLT